MRPDHDLPVAFVLGLNPNGLGIVKSLVRHGIPVLAMDARPTGWSDTHRWMSSRTRLCRKIWLPAGSPRSAFLERLLELGPSYSKKPVLLPSGDDEMLMIAENRSLLSDHYRFRAPSRSALDLFVRKVGFEAFCRTNKVPFPASVWNVTSQSVLHIGEDIRFPCLVKPEFRTLEWDRLFSPLKGLPAEDMADLKESVARAEASGAPLLVQEVIPGPDSLLHFSHVYLDEDSRMVQGWTGRKIRQLPIHFGTSTLTETVKDDEVMDLTLRLLTPVQYHGYASVEFKRDLRDGTLRVMEVTVGRTWYPHFLGVVAGVNLPLAWYLDLVGLPQKPPVTPRVPVRWVDEYRDIVASVDYWRAGELSHLSWVRSFRNLRGFALFSLRDPLPGLFVLARLFISLWNGGLRGLRRLFRWRRFLLGEPASGKGA